MSRSSAGMRALARGRSSVWSGWLIALALGLLAAPLGADASSFRLVINLKTARTLNLAIAQSVLSRADRVIQ